MHRRRNDLPDSSTSARLETGDEIHLTLFDPRLPDLFNGRGPIVGGSQSCRCTVAVQRQDGDGLLVRLPTCPDARACFCPGRVLHGACETPHGRMGFDVEVLTPQEADRVSDGSAKLSLPKAIRNANYRGTFRVRLAPAWVCRVPICPRESGEAWSALRESCSSHRESDELQLSEAARGLFVEGLITDVSLGGVGLAVRESPAFTEATVGQVVLLPVLLPDLPKPIACRVRVAWLRRVGERIVRMGGPFDTSGDRALSKQLEDELGGWILERQRAELRRVCR